MWIRQMMLYYPGIKIYYAARLLKLQNVKFCFV